MKTKDIKQKYANLSFAEAAEAIGKKYKNRDVDLIEKNSYEQELKQLSEYQEKKRLVSQMQESIKQFKLGGTLPKYENGTPENGLPKIEDPWNGINPNLPFIDNPFQGMINELPQSTLITPSVPPTLPQRGVNMIPGQLPTLGQRGINPVSDTKAIPLQVDSIPFKVNVDESKVSTEPRSNTEMSAYTPALIGQGISTALNLGILAQGYDKVDPITNPYESQIKNLMASRSIDTTQQRNQILSAYNAAKQGLNNTRSANVRNALDTNLMNITQDNLAQSKLQEQQINQDYKGEYANVLNNLGQQQAQATTYAEDMTARNKGNFQSNLSAFGASVADNSKFFTTSKLNEIQNKLMGDILNSKYSNIGLNTEVVQRLSQGKLTPDDITILKTAYGNEAATQLIKKFGE